ncbi:MAG TPA: metallophosphoesterase, partial [Ktedonobacterales bacterium]|nr:metallophosphoesterase [Ktedonobacterales bacterium]
MDTGRPDQPDEREGRSTTKSETREAEQPGTLAGADDGVGAGTVELGINPGAGVMAEIDPFQVARLRGLGIIPQDDRPPFDIIGDVHGCIEELRELLGKLGYARETDGSEAYAHPQGRRLIFVGDLEDRGPASMAVLRLVIATRDAGHALLVIGNHDNKFLRWLRGRNVRIGHGLEKTIQQLDEVPQPRRAALRDQIEALYATAPGYLLLDGGRLVVTHGAILDSMIGEWNERIASFCLYADVIGRTSSGRPIRRDWGAARNLAAAGGERAP